MTRYHRRYDIAAGLALIEQRERGEPDVVVDIVHPAASQPTLVWRMLAPLLQPLSKALADPEMPAGKAFHPCTGSRSHRNFGVKLPQYIK